MSKLEITENQWINQVAASKSLASQDSSQARLEAEAVMGAVPDEASQRLVVSAFPSMAGGWCRWPPVGLGEQLRSAVKDLQRHKREMTQ